MAADLIVNTANNYPRLYDSSLVKTNTFTQGDTLKIVYDIKNITGSSSTACTAAIYIDNPANGIIFFDNVISLGVGENIFLSHDYSTNNLTGGLHTFYIVADYYNNVLESNESNNTVSINFTVNATVVALPDLTTSLANNYTITQGNNLTFAYTVNNIGNASVSSSSLGVYIDGVKQSSTFSVGSISANGVLNGTASINTSGLSAGDHYLWVKANENSAVSESNESNNNSNTVTLTVNAPVPTNHQPTLNSPLQDASYTEGNNLAYLVSSNTFSDADGDTLNYTAKLTDGNSLPSWLNFNSTTRTFSGTIPSNTPDLNIRVTATDSGNLSFYDDVTFFTPNTPLDTSAPTLLDVTPSNWTSDSSRISPSSNIVLTFNEDVKAGTGNITITNLSTGGGRVISVTDSQITFSGNTMTINPTNDLSAGNWMEVTFGSGVVQNLNGVAYEGLIGNQLKFTTSGTAAPVFLPYDEQQTHNVMQGNNTTFTHKGALKWGVDFDFSFGEKILAVASGTVVAMRESIVDGASRGIYDNGAVVPGQEASMGTSNIGNFITIRHDDGSFATYAHFQQNSIPVEVGWRVIAGEVIGNIGNTGARTSTHLHLHFGSEPINWQAGLVANGTNDSSSPLYFNQLGNRSVSGADDGLTGDNTENNVVTGNGVNNRLLGFAGNDTIFGYGGNDILIGGNENDNLVGGDGNDTFKFVTPNEGTDNITDFVSETDRIQITGENFGLTANVAIALNSASTLPSASGTTPQFLYNTSNGQLWFDQDGTEGGYSAIHIATLTGNKTLLASDIQVVTNENIAGGGGGNDGLGSSDDDVLIGNIGNDVLEGLDGNDSLDGKESADLMNGGTGNDIYYVDNINDVVTEISTLDTEIDSIYSKITYTLPANVENMTLQAEGGAINATGSALNNTLIGNAAVNVLNGGGGADIMDAGDGNDIYIVDNPLDIVVEQYGDTQAGIDTVRASISYTLSDYIENLTLIGTTTINGTGNALKNVLTGNTKANILKGDAGSDILTGGLGKDNLTGGTGADKFKFATVAETGITVTTRDTITDFKHSQHDKIDLSSIDANTVVAGNNAFATLTQGAAFSGSFSTRGVLFFDQTTHVLYGNNDTDTAADFSIFLTGVTNLSAADFIL
jgi:Ca2+-binding RTX toxin-like protein